MSSNHPTFAVIMAGGVGTRFWPMSRISKPKQFLDILGTGRSLIQMTFDRLSSSIPASNILVVTNELYRSEVASHLPSLPPSNILCEPCMRNTAPCIAYANAVIASRISSGGGAGGSDAAIIVAPSDHLILNEAEFTRVLDLAISHTLSSSSLVTLGIQPSRPDTGYGYIKYSKSGDSEVAGSEIARVEQFTEKPDLPTAVAFLKSGEYCWNSGIFVWSLSNICSAFELHLPSMFALFNSEVLTGAPGEVDAIYSTCESLSIDYGILERASDVAVIPCDFGWSDLGTWTSLANHLEVDTTGNSAVGVDLLASKSSGNVVVSGGRGAGTGGRSGSEKGKLIAVRGLNDFIVVDTEDALLICPKSDEQWVKELVGILKKEAKEGVV